jgi:sodium/proline symporter
LNDKTVLIIVIIAYMILLLGYGLYQGKKVKNASDFAIAGRKLPGWVAALSERATGESSWALLGLPGAAYATGLMEVWTAIGCVMGIVVAWVFLAHRLRKEAAHYKADTFIDYIAKRHGDQGKWIRVVGSTIIVFFFFFYVGAQFLGGGKTLSSLFEIEPVWAMLLVVFLVIPYTIYGGFRSVTYTDVIQAILMIITLIAAPIAGVLYMADLPDGSIYASSVWEALEKAGPSYNTMTGGAILQEDSALAGTLNWVFSNGGEIVKGLGAGVIIAGAFSWFFGYLGGQPQLTTRFMAIKDEKQAKIARNIGVVWTLIAYTGALFIGWMGIALFGPTGLADQETVMPRVLTTLFNPVIAGILITGVLAAVISTANSLLILSATELSENIVKPLQKTTNAAQSLFRSRLLTATLAIIALGVAYVLPSKLIYSIVGYVWAGIGSTFSVVILLTLFWKRFHGKAALLSMIVGLVFTITWISSGMDQIITSRLMTFVVVIITAVLSTYLFKPTNT